jgi:hypothetical protein
MVILYASLEVYWSWSLPLVHDCVPYIAFVPPGFPRETSMTLPRMRRIDGRLAMSGGTEANSVAEPDVVATSSRSLRAV